MTDTAAQRGSVLRLEPERVGEYVTAHELVWPEMPDALSDAGWRNHSPFVGPDDGLVVGYLETSTSTSTEPLTP